MQPGSRVHLPLLRRIVASVGWTLICDVEPERHPNYTIEFSVQPRARGFLSPAGYAQIFSSEFVIISFLV
jgi:hypothetical protein